MTTAHCRKNWRSTILLICIVIKLDMQRIGWHTYQYKIQRMRPIFTTHWDKRAQGRVQHSRLCLFTFEWCERVRQARQKRRKPGSHETRLDSMWIAKSTHCPAARFPASPLCFSSATKLCTYSVLGVWLDTTQKTKPCPFCALHVP